MYRYIIFVYIIIFLFACNVVSEKTPAKAVVLIAVDSGQRTLHPELTSLAYKLHFEYSDSSASHSDESLNPGEVKEVTLEVGTWTISAYGFSGTNIISSATKTLAISAGTSQSLTMTLVPATDGTGIFEYDITLPADVSASLSLLNPDNAKLVISEPVALVAGTNHALLSIAPGIYRMLLDASNNHADATDIVHIYKGLTTNYTYSPQLPDSGKTPVGVDLLDLTDKFSIPVKDALATVIKITTDEYTGTVNWRINDGASVNGSSFKGATVYQAVVSLTEVDGYTFANLDENSFTYYGASGVIFDKTNNTVVVTFPETAAPIETESVDISINFWYEDINITGNNGNNVIKKSGSPNSVSFVAPSIYDDIMWFIDTKALGSAAGITIKANDYTLGKHNVTFTGRRASCYYSQRIELSIEQGDLSYTVHALDGSPDTVTTHGLEFNFSDLLGDFEGAQVTITNGTGAVTKGALVCVNGPSNSISKTWRLYFTGVERAGTISVSVHREGVTSHEDTITVYKAAPPPQFVSIDAASFTMGAMGGSYPYSDAVPHEVTLTRSYYIADHELTQDEWIKVMNTSPWYSRGPIAFGVGGSRPVYYVGWYDALAYCNKRSAQEGLSPVYQIAGISDWLNFDANSVPQYSDSVWDAVVWDTGANGYRLPSEAEWEYAARGGASSKGYIFSGAAYDNLNEVSWNQHNMSDGTIPGTTNGEYILECQPVKTRKPNELGLYDMSGNVAEYVWDRKGAHSAAAVIDPMGPDTGDTRVVRGGSWYDDGTYHMVFGRSVSVAPGSYSSSTYYRYLCGFRLARNQ